MLIKNGIEFTFAKKPHVILLDDAYQHRKLGGLYIEQYNDLYWMIICYLRARK
jgi:hypothetical protein